MLIDCWPLVRLPVNSRLLVVKFWGSQKLCVDFLLHKGLALLCYSRIHCISPDSILSLLLLILCSDKDDLYKIDHVIPSLIENLQVDRHHLLQNALAPLLGTGHSLQSGLLGFPAPSLTMCPIPYCTPALPDDL